MMNAESASCCNGQATQRHLGLGRRLTAGVAAFVLVLVAGVPLGSVQTFLPDPEDGDTPYLGI